jgi:hypothetical protein
MGEIMNAGSKLDATASTHDADRIVPNATGAYSR